MSSPKRDRTGLIVLKHGADGVSLVTSLGKRSVPGIPVDVVCGLGAGDALTAAFAAGLLRGLDPAVAVERGNAAGAIVATRLMCSTAMPTPAEIDELLARTRSRRTGGGRERTTKHRPGWSIHPAKLPMRLPPEALHIHPDADGVVATDPARAGWRYLAFRAFGLDEGETVLLDRPDHEAAIVTISGGGVEIALDQGPALQLPGRPSSSRACRGAPTSRPGRRPDRRPSAGRPASGRRAGAGAADRPGGVATEAILVPPSDVEIEIRGAGNATRQVNNIMMPGFPADRLLSARCSPRTATGPAGRPTSTTSTTCPARPSSRRRTTTR